jgi:hypothetical protein
MFSISRFNPSSEKRVNIPYAYSVIELLISGIVHQPRLIYLPSHLPITICELNFLSGSVSFQGIVFFLMVET